ncbi:universal stress protein [Nocardioides houyundeii]|uniref:universal stress protein n=1 Tax=Nocardioides houyundeii TaxID=2045452 RepID=UPI0013153337|nr:universal stress protein [Nocardioides houyundeii]
MTPQDIPPGAVLVAVDGSDHAARAVTWGARHAHLSHRALVLMHATGIGEPLEFPPLGVSVTDYPPTAEDPDRDDGLVLEVAEERARTVLADGAIVRVSVRDDPRRALVTASARAELLVLGSRGRGVFGSLVLGSVSAAVARHADCPVAVVRGYDEVDSLTRVVVGVDATAESRRAVEHAYRFASLHRVPILVVHCYWDVVGILAGGSGAPADDPGATQLEVEVRELIVGLGEDYPDVQARVVLRHGLVDTVLAENALLGDVIVVGRHEAGSAAQFLARSVSTAVLERARSTVIVVPFGTKGH